jgi:hypothetical protein
MSARPKPPIRELAEEPIIGIPYARQVVVGNRVFAICPRCAARVELIERKDFESASADAYARHYFAEHAVADGLVKRGDRWFGPRAAKP